MNRHLHSPLARGCAGWPQKGLRNVPIMDNLMEKNMDNEMVTGVIKGIIGVIV